MWRGLNKRAMCGGFEQESCVEGLNKKAMCGGFEQEGYVWKV